MPIKNPDTSITVCACAYRKIMNSMEINKLISALRNKGRTVKVVQDLCQTAISDAGQMAEIASTTVVACYPRAVRSIFDALGLKPKRVFDIRNHSSEQILDEMGISNPVFSPEQSLPESLPGEEQEAWNPVIDKERCTDCGKCHDFCLFGVYSVNEGTVKVTQPRNCKNNCPACARVCPSKAIIFPKYEKSPINGGLHDEEDAIEMNTKELYNAALRRKLEERRAKVPLIVDN
jgi:heterodisulfide reductase subunit A-like polyferredoxin